MEWVEYEKGDEAAKIIADSVFTFLNTQKEFSEFVFQKAVNKANLAIRQINVQNNIKSGATIGGVLIENNRIHVFWVGDVQIGIRISEQRFFISKSHTMINALIDSKSQISPENIVRYSHIVTRSVSGDISKSVIGYKCFKGIPGVSLILIGSDCVQNNIPLQRIFDENIEMSKIEEELRSVATDNFSLLKIKYN